MSQPRLLLATRSAEKAREIREILGGTGLRFVTLTDLELQPHPDEDAVESFDTFRGNALAKARYFVQVTGLAALADDSGLCVDALGGAPGVRSKRFAQDAGAEVGSSIDQANNDLLLHALRNVPGPDRTARYLCAAALALPAGPELVTLGACEGRILAAPLGTGGFGYDPLFAPLASDRSFGQWSADEKNRVSHRARAFRALAPLASWAAPRLDWHPPHR